MNIPFQTGRVFRPLATLASAAFLALALPFTVAFAQPDLNLQDTSANSPGTAEISYDFTNTDPAEVCGISVCIVFDPAEVDSVDTSSCLDGVPEPHASSTFSACELETGGGECAGQGYPVDETIRLALVDFGSTIDDFTGAGPIEVNLASGLTTGDTVTLTNNIVEVLDCTGTDVTPGTFTDANIEVVEESAVLNVQPPSIGFPDTQSGFSSAAEPITISNDGTDEIDLQVSSIAYDDDTHFEWSDIDCGPIPFTLADGESCEIEAVFSPQAIGGPFSANLVIGSDAGQVTNDAVAVSGTGTEGPAGALIMEPDPIEFGDVLTGETSSMTVTVTSDGADNSTVDGISLALGDNTHYSIPAGSDNCSGEDLPKNASCTFELVFDPQSAGDGLSTSVTAEGTDGNGDTQSASVTATGDGVEEARFVSNLNVNLGVAAPGSSLNESVSISNEGNQDLTISNCSGLSGDTSQISLGSSPESLSPIAAGEAGSFDVSCTVPDPGSYSASLTCDTNDPNNGTVTYNFSCTGQPLVIPTMQPWGLVVLTMLMLMVGGLSIRYFRV
ncbi:choice-of-anchor D domain-containing protein [Wenzhouxiangella sp. EGI_FJ10305]|uniref:choice-of-anchor D domain-containing protein n=1 Tax=Wenzhouxiangella sp. EGI_FJ10305 TaxID=3243768 RepID=UPI0035E1F541